MDHGAHKGLVSGLMNKGFGMNGKKKKKKMPKAPMMKMMDKGHDKM